MKKTMKWIGILVGMVLLLTILLVISLATFVNPNRFKPLLAEKIKYYIGSQLIIDSDLSWTIFPTFGVKTGHLVLKNPDGFDQGMFAEVKNVTVSIKLMPLLHKKIESNGIKLEGMKLHLIKNSQGKVNWNFHEESPKTSSTMPSEKHAQSSPLAVAILGLTMSDSEITWTDEQKKQFVSLENVNLVAKDINLLKPFPVSLKFTMVNTAKALHSKVSLSTHASLNVDAEVFSFRDIKIMAHTQQNKQTINITLTGDVMADMAKETLQWENFHAQSDALSLMGKVSVTNLMTHPITTGHLQLAPFDLRKWLKDSGQDIAMIQVLKNVSGEVDLIPAAKSIALKGKLVIDEIDASHVKMTHVVIPTQYHQGILSLTPISASFYQGKCSGDMNIDFNTAMPRVAILASLNHFNVAAWMQDLSPNQKLTLAGNGNIDIKMTTVGDGKQAILKNMHGQGHFSFDNGVLKGIDMNYLISSATAKVTKKDSLASNTQQTNFNELKGSFVIQGGVIGNNDLVMSSTDFATQGQGSIDLLNQTIDYRLQTWLTQMGQGKPWMNLYGLAIPIRVTGSLKTPHIGLDIDALTKLIAEQQVQKVKTQLQERIEKGKIPEKAGKFLQNLLGR